MTPFYLLSPDIRFFISISILIAALTRLALCMYEFIRTERFGYCVKDFIFFILITAFLTLAITDRSETLLFTINIPWVVILVFFILITISGILRIISEYKKSKHTLSSSSIKQALDNLNSGICFSDERGKIILINHLMRRIIYNIKGNYPQTSDDLILSGTDAQIISRDGNSILYKFPDNTIFLFVTSRLKKDGFEGYTQSIFQDVTELYETNLKIEKENEELIKTNEKTKLMYDRLADRIREEEMLELKTKIHNDIGTSLIEISAIISGNTNESTQMQINRLRDAVSYFSDNRVISYDTMDKVYEYAKKVGVTIIVHGEIPSDNEKIICAACIECITNCIRHADGNKIFLTAGNGKIVITNNGKPPEKTVTEGGGLSNLRKAIQLTGGEMQIKSKPEFMLIIDLKKGDKKND